MAAGWGRLAKGALGAGMDAERRMAVELLALGPGDRVLDLACGTGAFTREFAGIVGAGGRAVGLDAAPAMLARAAAATPAAAGVDYVLGDAGELPFGDASFDAVCCFAALHLFAAPWRALDEMTRVLAPGGRLALLASCRTSRAPTRTADGLLGAAIGVRMFERDELTGALAERGFGDLRQQVQGLAQFVGGRLSP